MRRLIMLRAKDEDHYFCCAVCALDYQLTKTYPYDDVEQQFLDEANLAVDGGNEKEALAILYSRDAHEYEGVRGIEIEGECFVTRR